MSTDENDVVLDPFIGAGTTTIAAKRLGRNYIGIDIDQAYVNVTKKKLAVETPESKIAGIWVSCYLNQVATIRNCDWEDLSQYFIIPENRKELDFTKIKLIKSQSETLDQYLNKSNGSK